MSSSEMDISAILAKSRYDRIKDIVDQTVTSDKGAVKTYTEMLDRAFLHRYLGIPIFLTFLWVMFQFAFTVSEPFAVMIEEAFSLLGGVAEQRISQPHLASFIAQGVFGGLGAVLVFIPPIFGLFLALSILEDSGYLARAAFLMDRLMSRLGLCGHSFIPMMIGFGCNVPAIMATRSMNDERDRMITILVSPFISCSARLPVYVLIAGAVFGPAYAGTAVFSVYAIGIALAILSALAFRKTLFRGETSPFLLELPEYALPNARSALLHMWARGRAFLHRAGTLIFGTTVIVWFLSVNPWEATGGGQLVAESYLAQLGHAMQPLVSPLGWDWMTAVALLFGLLAKEVVVGTYGVLLGTGEATLGESLVSLGIFTPLSGFAFMCFVLIYVPCAATLGAISRETNSIRWPAFVLVFQTALAFAVSGLVVGAGRLLGFA
ncbi:MAG TPA: ferrous iron transport protein B [Methanotrichaceae archaeon]|nr:ferrous iron transport protein B [Methanotrichaceae archaeon]HQF15874.1 ferrous iron transport protein B [Methanotrichaceae archaeon]HQI90450.1 ferrous iron transport protein B [Methanotrichaceae archaeon]HQJ28161.1 ferrous iron transport protein B [Methanotrichaceae archaeon]